ncbi:Asp-tRNA(Asn)/Glu-tRNA(Gln) amidotransferase subunit GatC [Texcoconibacillus texcoconensis]|uniref:Aspartyl/glutamyl-tRNA(Asn/Gln) amidotransferase subunit C n=1 Tax=Texcoconibacillus texcoconensis TaxID=1095777 RepID=A0A840QMG3_9BACI|nr:Asp-tRNA(Asn)/Glu-tRNA(Gln) amidotransferase subunit GatC [Texcoconibacillus texcoconensis]MBB5172546.1 aspartyl-tRNA(Asn)/glutamyl-tRNA(Gln) amidotransferase subunit C [Texcoconibacillus texcoconensis]
MARLTKEQVEHVAHLARLDLSDDEVERMTTQLDDIIGFAELLNELDTANVEPTSHVLDVKNVVREDERRPSSDREDVLKNAPDQQDGQVKVPSVLE